MQLENEQEAQTDISLEKVDQITSDQSLSRVRLFATP